MNDSATTIIVGMVTIGLTGALLDLAMQRSQRRLLPWLPQRSGAAA